MASVLGTLPSAATDDPDPGRPCVGIARVGPYLTTVLEMLGFNQILNPAAPVVALGFIFSCLIPPFSEGSNFGSHDSGIVADAPLMWTNVHSGDIILDTKIRDWVR